MTYEEIVVTIATRNMANSYKDYLPPRSLIREIKTLYSCCKEYKRCYDFCNNSDLTNNLCYSSSCTKCWDREIAKFLIDSGGPKL